MNLLCSTAHMMKILLMRTHAVKCTYDEVLTAQNTYMMKASHDGRLT